MSQRRVIAQRIRTGEILSWDVPLAEASLTRDLSGPGGIVGTITPDARMLLGPDGKPLLREWSTALYYEADGLIRGGGIVARISEEDEDGLLAVEAPGFSAYPHGIPYTGYYAPGTTDPLHVVREIWTHLQAQPDGDLGMEVDGILSGRTVGDAEQPYALPWWEHRDCGSEIDSMLDLASADYYEQHEWNADHTEISHRLRLGVPRLGRRRNDLRFVEGENVIQPVPYIVDGDHFAQTVIALGKGEGSAMVRAEVATRDDRLRRVAVVADKTADQAKVTSLAKAEHKARSDSDSFGEVVIRDHDNARISEIQPGDDIEVEATLTWYGRTRQWVRVLAITEQIDGDDIATLTTASASNFAA